MSVHLHLLICIELAQAGKLFGYYRHLVVNEWLPVFESVEIVGFPWREDLSVLKSLVEVFKNHSNELVLPIQPNVQEANVVLEVLLKLILFGLHFELELHSPLANPAIALHVMVQVPFYNVPWREVLINVWGQNRHLRRWLIKRQSLLRQHILHYCVFGLVGNYKPLTVHPACLVPFYVDPI